MKVKVGTHREKWGVQRVHPSIWGESGYDFELIPLRSQKVGYPKCTQSSIFGVTKPFSFPNVAEEVVAMFPTLRL